MSYTNTSLDRFSEGGVKRSKRLQYHAMEIDNVDTELAMKFTYPIRDGQRSLFMPSLRLGWAADWGNSGNSQKVSYIDSGDSYHRHQRRCRPRRPDRVRPRLHQLQLQRHLHGRLRPHRCGDLGEQGTSWQVQGGLSFRFEVRHRFEQRHPDPLDVLEQPGCRHCVEAEGQTTRATANRRDVPPTDSYSRASCSR